MIKFILLLGVTLGVALCGTEHVFGAEIPEASQIAAADLNSCTQSAEWLYCRSAVDGHEYRVARDVSSIRPSVDPTRPYNNSGSVGTAVPAMVGSAVLNPTSTNPITLQAAPAGYHWECVYAPYSREPKACYPAPNPTLLGTILGVAAAAGAYELVCHGRNAYYNPRCRGY